MPIKEVFAPHLGRKVKLGRRRPVALGPHLRFARYVRGTFPAPPSSIDYTSKAATILADVMGNDALGDCVIAGGYHVVGVETANAGDPFHATSAQIIHDYSAIGHYVPGNPATDNGCNLQDALNFWTAHGFANGTKLTAWLAVDPSNQAECMAALWLFENLYFGFELPDAWISPFPSADGFTWDVAGAPDGDNGHCVPGAAYTPSGVEIITWGLKGLLTWAALRKYGSSGAGGEAYVMLTPDQIAKGQSKAPNGFAWADLLGDWNALGGAVPIPAPTPAPPAPAPPAPTPAPSAPPTLSQAQGALKTAFAGLHPLLTNPQALAAAQRALTPLWPPAS
jgi:hypothetical protein